MIVFSAKINRLAAQRDLLKSGFMSNQEKSQWEPLQIITGLGVILNTVDSTVKATSEGLVKLNANLAFLST